VDVFGAVSAGVPVRRAVEVDAVCNRRSSGGKQMKVAIVTACGPTPEQALTAMRSQIKAGYSVWIAPYVKGPEGAPLLGGEKVYAVTNRGAA